MSARRLGRTSSVALGFAAVWAVGLVAAGLFVPVYGSEASSSAGSRTLVGENGIGIVFVLAVPFAATLLVAVALLLRRRRGAVPVAWALTVLLAGFNLLSLLTIGLFVVPVTVALVIACAAVPDGPSVEPAAASPA